MNRPPPDPDGQQRRVLLLPPACCGAGYLRPLSRELGRHGMAVTAVDLPMHGRRWREQPVLDAREAVADVAQRCTPSSFDVVYGESMGAYLGLLLLASADGPVPPLVVASNRAASTRAALAPGPVRTLADAQRVFAELGGEMPADMNDELAGSESTFALLRGDIALSRSLIEASRTARTPGPVVALRGSRDRAVTDVSGWWAHGDGTAVPDRCLDGGHLLSSANPAGVADVIVTTTRRHPRHSTVAAAPEGRR